MIFDLFLFFCHFFEEVLMRFSILFVSVATARKTVTYDEATGRLKITEGSCTLEIALPFRIAEEKRNAAIKAMEAHKDYPACLQPSASGGSIYNVRPVRDTAHFGIGENKIECYEGISFSR